jgi:hypothetical protein
MSKGRGVFEDYRPNLWLFFSGLLVYAIGVQLAPMPVALIFCLAFLLLGWSMAFAKKEKKK